MLEHEHGDAAFEYVIGYDEPSTLPFGVTSAPMQWFGDEERRLAFRCAIEAWRAARGDRFIPLLEWQWMLLPTHEARSVAQEIVSATLEQSDQPITASYDQASYDREGTVPITSRRVHTLFQILHVLRHVDGAL